MFSELIKPVAKIKRVENNLIGGWFDDIISDLNTPITEDSYLKNIYYKEEQIKKEKNRINGSLYALKSFVW